MTETMRKVDTGDRREEVRVSEEPGFKQRERVVEDLGAARRQTLEKVTQFVWLFAGVLEGLIGLRVILRLFAANPGNPFARFVYEVTSIFLWPFRTLTASPSAGNRVLEIPSLIAMLVFALLAWVIVQLIWLIFSRSSTRSVSVYQREHR